MRRFFLGLDRRVRDDPGLSQSATYAEALCVGWMPPLPAHRRPPAGTAGQPEQDIDALVARFYCNQEC